MFGTTSSPAGTDDFGTVTLFTVDMNQAQERIQGIGTGRNATNFVNKALATTGTIDFQLNQLDVLRYLVGAVSAVNSAAGPGGEDVTEIREVDNIGFGASEVPTATLEVGSTASAASTDDALQITGTAFNNTTITSTQGEITVVTTDFVAKQGTSSTTLEVFAPSSSRPFVFIDGSVTLGSDVISEVVSFAVTIANNLFTYYSLGSLFIKQPVMGIRRYDWTIVMKHSVDDAASTLSGIESRELFFGAAARTTTTDEGQFAALGTLDLSLSEGAATGDRVLRTRLESNQIVSISEPVDLGGGIIELTLTGFGLA